MVASVFERQFLEISTNSTKSLNPRVLSIGGSILHKLDSPWCSECEGRLFSRRDEAVSTVPSNFTIVYVK